MEIDKALARGIAREIRKRRETAQAEDARTGAWTDRDVARRMTKAGHPMQHPAVIRARGGTRTVSAQEWLTFALVLSVAPLSLLDPGESVDVGGDPYRVEDVAAWLTGVRPLASVESPGLFYATAGGMRAPQGTHFAGVLRAYADHFDTTNDENERLGVLVDIARTALDQVRADERLDQVKEARRGRVPARKGGDE